LSDKIFAICDLDSSYTYNFMEHFEKKFQRLFSVQAFTNVESLQTFLEKSMVEVLLISASAFTEEVCCFNIKTVLILEEGDIITERKDYPVIYKYQSSDLIMKEALGYYMDSSSNAGGRYLDKRFSLIIGIYSPVRRSCKTSFALALGQVLAQNLEVLYLNLEEYSGFRELFSQEYNFDISDALYFMKHEETWIKERLSLLCKGMGKMDYIPPLLTYRDFTEIEQEEWNEFVQALVTSSKYEVIIIDYSDCIKNLLEQLSNCDYIFTPVLEDRISRAKVNQFYELINHVQIPLLKERIIELKVPYLKELSEGDLQLDSLLWGKLGHFARQVVEKYIEEI
jgi:hypothetical protein